MLSNGGPSERNIMSRVIQECYWEGIEVENLMRVFKDIRVYENNK